MVHDGDRGGQQTPWFDIPAPLATRIMDTCDVWGTTVVFAGSRGEESVSLAELLDQAGIIAASLQMREIAPRDHIAIFGLTSRSVVTAILGTWLAGAAVTVLPIPMRLRDLNVLAAQARSQADAAGAALVVAEDQFVELLSTAPGAAPVVSISNLVSQPGQRTASHLQPPAVDLDDLAVLQLTSGATGEPKIVEVTHRQVAENHRCIVDAAQLEVGNEVAVSWLPLYHDMGLMGFLALPLSGARKLVLASPETFILSPGSWMQLLSRHRATVTGGPSFAYAMAARALKSTSNLDLSSLKVTFNGGEPVAFEATRQFLDAAAVHGLSPSALLPVYGMAEATLMATCPRPGSTPLWDPIDTTILREEGLAVSKSGSEQGRPLAMLGPPISGMSLRVVDQDGNEMADRQVGEIELRGPSVTAGYFRRDDLTASVFRDGWLRTGDRGYLVGESLVVCGRWKDMLILGGRNIEPEEIELAVERLEGIRAGNVVAFSLGETGERQKLVIVAEAKAHTPALARQVGQAVRSSVGVWPDEVVLVPPSTLPKTSSGKVRRRACRTSFLDGELETID